MLKNKENIRGSNKKNEFEKKKNLKKIKKGVFKQIKVCYST